MGDQWIGPGVPLAIVDAIQDPHEIVSALAQQTFQAKPLLRSHDLLGIGWAHSGDFIGETSAPLRKLILP